MKNQKYPFYEVESINNLKELVDHAAKTYGDKPAFTFEGNDIIVNISYHQFKFEVDALGTALFDLIADSTRIALIGENSYEWILVLCVT